MASDEGKLEQASEGAQSSSEGSEQREERRKLARRKIKVKKIFAAEVQIDQEPQSCFLHIHDLSEGGMRIHTDFGFPEGSAIPVRLYLDEPLELVVERVWAKELVGGMHVMGLRFEKVTAEERERIRGFLEKYSPENRRKSFRLERILMVEMVLGSTRQKFGVFTLDMSSSGMQITHEFPLPEDMEIPFKVLLEYDKDPVDLQARVQWQKQNTFGQYLIGLEFVDVDPTSRERIDSFIDSNLEGKGTGGQTFATLDNFSVSDLGL